MKKKIEYWRHTKTKDTLSLVQCHSVLLSLWVRCRVHPGFGAGQTQGTHRHTIHINLGSKPTPLTWEKKKRACTVYVDSAHEVHRSNYVYKETCSVLIDIAKKISVSTLIVDVSHLNFWKHLLPFWRFGEWKLCVLWISMLTYLGHKIVGLDTL